MPYDGYTDYFEEPVIVSVATTGGLHGKDANPKLPEQPDEVIDDLVDCEAAGASVVHLHARDEAGDPTKDTERFQRLSDLVRERPTSS